MMQTQSSVKNAAEKQELKLPKQNAAQWTLNMKILRYLGEVKLRVINFENGFL